MSSVSSSSNDAGSNLLLNEPNFQRVVLRAKKVAKVSSAKVVSQDALPKDFYIAYPLENPHSTWESFKETAKFSVEIDDERAELWEKEILPLTDLSYAIDDAIGDAYSAIVEAARALDHACEKSKNFRNYSA